MSQRPKHDLKGPVHAEGLKKWPRNGSDILVEECAQQLSSLEKERLWAGEWGFNLRRSEINQNADTLHPRL